MGSLPGYQQGLHSQALRGHRQCSLLVNKERRHCRRFREPLDVRAVAFFGKQSEHWESLHVQCIA
jgi:hypothetical protein